MTPSAPRPVLSAEAAVTAAAEEVLGGAPEGLTRLAGGMNNAMYRLEHAGRALVAKLYFQHPSDPRDRLGTEFQMLRFFWDCGVRCIPEPLGVSRAHGVGFCSYVEGVRLSGPVTECDLDEYAQFVLLLWGLSHDTAAKGLPLASEASFRLDDRLCTVANRLTWLTDALDPSALEARSFLAKEAAPLFERVGEWARQVLDAAGLEANDPVPEAHRALSPGDVGFHNCLRTEKGLVFHDFEYGGWDDLAQVMVQMCLAPGVPVPEDAHPRLLNRLVNGAGGGDRLAVRVRLNYPILALKWGLIMLNELIDVGRSRRVFSGSVVDDQEASRVSKARKMLEVAERAIGPLPPLSVPALTARGF